MTDLLTQEEVKKLAMLAKLELTDEEISKYQKELSDVLKYFTLLDTIDTEGLKPTSQVTGLVNVMRADNVTKQAAKPEDLMILSPKSQDQYIKVKRMI